MTHRPVPFHGLVTFLTCLLLLTIVGCSDDSSSNDTVGSVCGDGTCSDDENAESCAADCEDSCGDGICDDGEDCPADCDGEPECGDGACDDGEDADTCPEDCDGEPECGDGTCDDGEDADTCPEDCDGEPGCGDGTCDDGEDAATCPEDCDDEPECGDGACDDGEDADTCPEDCAECVDDDACQDGQICVANGCVEGCRDDEDCEEGLVCDGESNLCVQAPNPCVADGNEPNDNPGDAADLGLGAFDDLTLCATDTDFFVVNLGHGDRLSFAARFDDGVAIDLVDVDSEILAAGAARDDGAGGSYVALADGAYYVRVQAPDSTESTDLAYGLDLAVETADELCPPDDSEPNDDADAATPLTTDGLQARTACLGNSDFYTYETEAGERTEVRLVFAHDDADLTLIATVGGVEIGRGASDTDGETLLLDHVEGGTVVLEVVTATEVGGSSYDVELARFESTQCSRDALEPNVVDRPALVEPGTHADLSVCSDKRDHYAFELGFHDEITIDLAFEHDNGDIDIALRGPDAEVLATSAGVSDTEDITHLTATPGTYTLEVQVLGRDISTTYDMTVAIVRGPDPPDCTDASEPNNETDEAEPFGEDLTIDAHTVCADDPDYFLLDLDTTALLDLSAQSEIQFGAYDVELLAADGVTVLGQASSSPDGASIAHLAEPGIHYVHVTHTGGGTTAYDLRATLTTPPDCEDPFEPNDDADGATTLPDSGLTGAMVCQDEVDVFAFETVEPLTEMTFQASFDDRFGDIQLEILDTDGVTVLEIFSEPGAGETAVYVFEEVGAYYLRVSLVSGTNTAFDLEVLRRIVLDCSDDLEPNNTTDDASVLEPGTVLGLTLCTEADTADFFTFQVDEEGPHTVNLAFVDADGDIDMELLAADGETVLDASLGVDDGEQVGGVLEPGTYFVRVYLLGRGVQNTYDIRLTEDGADCDDDFEPNNFAREATPLGDVRLADLTLCSDDDPADFWAVTLTENSSVRIEVEFESLFGNIDLELLDTDGETVLETSTRQGDREFVVATLEQGTYYARVYLPEQDQSVSYAIQSTVGSRIDCDDRFEPNNTLAQAPLVDPGAYDELTVCRGNGDDPFDFFAVFLESGDEVTVDLSFIDAAGDIDLRLFGPDGVTLLDSSGGTGDSEQVNAVVEARGYYYIRVNLFTNGVRNVYDMTIAAPERTPPDCVDDDDEPNDNVDQAPDLDGGVEDRMICPGDADYYRVLIGAGEILSAELDFVHADGNLTLELRDEDGGLLAHSDTSSADDDSESVAYRSSQATVAFLRVGGAGLSSNRYALSAMLVDQLPVEDCQDALEPNNSTRGAIAIESGTLYEDLDACADTDMDDFYVIQADAGSLLDVEVLFSREDGADLALRILGPDGETVLLNQDGFGDDEIASVPVVESGLHFIHVSYSDFFEDRNTYSLRVTTEELACEDDGREPDDSPLNATLLAPGTYAGQICPGDTDFVSFLADEGTFTVATLTFDGDDGNLGLRLLDEDQAVLAESNRNFGDTETINVEIPAIGLYFLEVFGTGLAYTSYELAFGPAICTDEFEPNNTVDTAAPIEPGMYDDLALCSPDTNPDDFYLIALEAGDEIHILLEFIDAEGDIDLDLFDLNHEDLLDNSNGVGDTEEIRYQVEADGIYLFRVELFTTNATTQYDLTVSVD